MKLEKKKLQKSQRKSRIRELTNKERFLITLLAMVVLFWLSFNYIIDPQLLKIANLQREISDYGLEIEENNRMLKNANLIVEEKNQLSLEKENIEKDFFQSLSQPEIIYILDEVLSKSNIEMQSISFTKPFIETLNDREIRKMNISIPFEGDFKSLEDLIESIEKEDRKIIINSIVLEKDSKVEIVGDINLGVYSLSGITDIAKDDLPIEVTDDNKLNPFIPYIGYVDPNERAEEIENSLEDEERIEENLEKEEQKDKLEGRSDYDTYKAVKGDNVSYISKKFYGSESYVDEILRLNGMNRSSILPIGKELKLLETKNK